MLFPSLVFLLRPRHIMFTPPPLSKRIGKFYCANCNNTWASSQIWVTKATEKPYQGESCERCGTTAKPFYIGRHEASIFNRVPLRSSNSHSTKRKRYDWRVNKGRR